MMSNATVMPDGSLCKPNISGAGIRRRFRLGAVAAVLAVALAASVVASRARWPWSLTVFVPAAVAAVYFLQAGRKTCVARAAAGTFEREDFSTTPADEDDAARSREVATKITRDSVLIGFAAVAATVIMTRLR
ncbi:MAG TPA: hypothetical protein VHL80_04525 [Polyangia bacterium]|nr:hypothetical protein [Polyangia bacterium]